MIYGGMCIEVIPVVSHDILTIYRLVTVTPVTYVERRFGTTSDFGRRSTKISGKSRNSENDLIFFAHSYPKSRNSTYSLYLESSQIAVHSVNPLTS